MSESPRVLADIMAGFMKGIEDRLTIQPEPSLPDRLVESNRRLALFATMQDRGCPTKLAREVSKLRPGHACESTHALEAVMGWLMIEPGQVGRECCVLSGERGRGKSYAAAQALASVKPGNGCSRWANARHVSTWLHTRGSVDSSRRNLDRIMAAPLLVLDDMGWEHFDRGGYAQGAFIGIMDDRIQAELRTIMTTNMGEIDFRERYGHALHDRCRGYGLWVDVERGPSLR